MNKWTDGDAVTARDQGRPSRWWTVYHLWAGMCLKLFLDISGLSKLLLGAPQGSSPGAASTYATAAAVIAVVAVILGYLGSKSAVGRIDASEMSRTARTAVKVALPFAYLVAAVLLGAVLAPQPKAAPLAYSSPQAPTSPDAMAEVRAFDTAQSAEGFTEASLDQAALKNIETWLVETILEKARAHIAQLGHDPTELEPAISAGAVFVDASGKRLGIIKIRMEGLARIVAVVGFVGPEFHRVTCMRNTDHDIPVWSGECGAKIQEVFNVSVKP